MTGVYEGIGTAVPLALFAYDADGRLASRTEGQGSAVAYGHDGIGRLAGLADTFPSGYGNVTTAFAYNPAGQIAGLSRNNDLYAWTGAYTANRPYTANGLNQYTAAGPVALTYDLNGNLASETTPNGTTNYTYDVENRLVAASGARTAALRYDPLGRLYEVSGASGTMRFLYDGDALVDEYGANGALHHRYVHGADAGADDPLVWYGGGTTHWLHSDHQGSITGFANTSGNLSAINAYDEYGIPRAGNVGRFQYTGQAWIPELGMYHYKARIYSPTLGRFLQTDRIGYEGGVNLYGFVGNDPVNMTDPTGEVPVCDFTPGGCGMRPLTPEEERRRDEAYSSVGWFALGFLPGVGGARLLIWGGRAVAVGRAVGAVSFGAARTFIYSTFARGAATAGRTTNFIGNGGRQGAERLFRGLTAWGNRGLDSSRTVVGRLRDGTYVNIRTQALRDGSQRTTVELQRIGISSRIPERLKVRFDERR
jgi:RHS repeat-associated protein